MKLQSKIIIYIFFVLTMVNDFELQQDSNLINDIDLDDYMDFDNVPEKEDYQEFFEELKTKDELLVPVLIYNNLIQTINNSSDKLQAKKILLESLLDDKDIKKVITKFNKRSKKPTSLLEQGYLTMYFLALGLSVPTINGATGLFKDADFQNNINIYNNNIKPHIAKSGKFPINSDAVGRDYSDDFALNINNVVNFSNSDNLVKQIQKSVSKNPINKTINFDDNNTVILDPLVTQNSVLDPILDTEDIVLAYNNFIEPKTDEEIQDKVLDDIFSGNIETLIPQSSIDDSDFFQNLQRLFSDCPQCMDQLKTEMQQLNLNHFDNGDEFICDSDEKGVFVIDPSDNSTHYLFSFANTNIEELDRPFVVNNISGLMLYYMQVFADTQRRTQNWTIEDLDRDIDFQTGVIEIYSDIESQKDLFLTGDVDLSKYKNRDPKQIGRAFQFIFAKAEQDQRDIDYSKRDADSKIFQFVENLVLSNDFNSWEKTAAWPIFEIYKIGLISEITETKADWYPEIIPMIGTITQLTFKNTNTVVIKEKYQSLDLVGIDKQRYNFLQTRYSGFNQLLENTISQKEKEENKDALQSNLTKVLVIEHNINFYSVKINDAFQEYQRVKNSIFPGNLYSNQINPDPTQGKILSAAKAKFESEYEDAVKDGTNNFVSSILSLDLRGSNKEYLPEWLATYIDEVSNGAVLQPSPFTLPVENYDIAIDRSKHPFWQRQSVSVTTSTTNGTQGDNQFSWLLDAQETVQGLDRNTPPLYSFGEILFKEPPQGRDLNLATRDIIRNTKWEKVGDTVDQIILYYEMNPEKLAGDVFSVIISAILAEFTAGLAFASTLSKLQKFGKLALMAGSFTAYSSAIEGIRTGVEFQDQDMDFWQGFKVGTGYLKQDLYSGDFVTNDDFIADKIFDFGSNLFVFGAMGKITKTMEGAITKSLIAKSSQSVSSKLGMGTIKTMAKIGGFATEVVSFTAFGAAYGSVFGAYKEEMEMQDPFALENLASSMVQNVIFLGSLKIGNAIAHPITSSLSQKMGYRKRISQMENQNKKLTDYLKDKKAEGKITTREVNGETVFDFTATTTKAEQDLISNTVKQYRQNIGQIASELIMIQQSLNAFQKTTEFQNYDKFCVDNGLKSEFLPPEKILELQVQNTTDPAQKQLLQEKYNQLKLLKQLMSAKQQEFVLSDLSDINMNSDNLDALLVTSVTDIQSSRIGLINNLEFVGFDNLGSNIASIDKTDPNRRSKYHDLLNLTPEQKQLATDLHNSDIDFRLKSLILQGRVSIDGGKILVDGQTVDNVSWIQTANVLEVQNFVNASRGNELSHDMAWLLVVDFVCGKPSFSVREEVPDNLKYLEAESIVYIFDGLSLANWDGVMMDHNQKLKIINYVAKELYGDKPTNDQLIKTERDIAEYLGRSAYRFYKENSGQILVDLEVIEKLEASDFSDQELAENTYKWLNDLHDKIKPQIDKLKPGTDIYNKYKTIENRIIENKSVVKLYISDFSETELEGWAEYENYKEQIEDFNNEFGRTLDIKNQIRYLSHLHSKFSTLHKTITISDLSNKYIDLMRQVEWMVIDKSSRSQDLSDLDRYAWGFDTVVEDMFYFVVLGDGVQASPKDKLFIRDLEMFFAQSLGVLENVSIEKVKDSGTQSTYEFYAWNADGDAVVLTMSVTKTNGDNLYYLQHAKTSGFVDMPNQSMQYQSRYSKSLYSSFNDFQFDLNLSIGRRYMKKELDFIELLSDADRATILGVPENTRISYEETLDGNFSVSYNGTQDIVSRSQLYYYFLETYDNPSIDKTTLSKSISDKAISFEKSVKNKNSGLDKLSAIFSDGPSMGLESIFNSCYDFIFENFTDSFGDNFETTVDYNTSSDQTTISFQKDGKTISFVVSRSQNPNSTVKIYKIENISTEGFTIDATQQQALNSFQSDLNGKFALGVYDIGRKHMSQMVPGVGKYTDMSIKEITENYIKVSFVDKLTGTERELFWDKELLDEITNNVVFKNSGSSNFMLSYNTGLISYTTKQFSKILGLADSDFRKLITPSSEFENIPVLMKRPDRGVVVISGEAYDNGDPFFVQVEIPYKEGPGGKIILDSRDIKYFDEDGVSSTETEMAPEFVLGLYKMIFKSKYIDQQLYQQDLDIINQELTRFNKLEDKIEFLKNFAQKDTRPVYLLDDLRAILPNYQGRYLNIYNVTAKSLIENSYLDYNDRLTRINEVLRLMIGSKWIAFSTAKKAAVLNEFINIHQAYPEGIFGLSTADLMSQTHSMQRINNKYGLNLSPDQLSYLTRSGLMGNPYTNTAIDISNISVLPNLISDYIEGITYAINNFNSTIGIKRNNILYIPIEVGGAAKYLAVYSHKNGNQKNLSKMFSIVDDASGDIPEGVKQSLVEQNYQIKQVLPQNRKLSDIFDQYDRVTSYRELDMKLSLGGFDGESNINQLIKQMPIFFDISSERPEDIVDPNSHQVRIPVEIIKEIYSTYGMNSSGPDLISYRGLKKKISRMMEQYLQKKGYNKTQKGYELRDGIYMDFYNGRRLGVYNNGAVEYQNLTIDHIVEINNTQGVDALNLVTDLSNMVVVPEDIHSLKTTAVDNAAQNNNNGKKPNLSNTPVFFDYNGQTIKVDKTNGYRLDDGN